MTKNDAGKMWVSKVTLKPEIAWSGEKRPTPAELHDLHHRAHEECFIANSYKGEVVVD
jgi:organic hydroperoxide reductase OsmC/OhrA